MRMILIVYPFDEYISQCLLYRDGKYRCVHYYSNSNVSKYNFDFGRGYDALLKDTNEYLLRQL